MMINTSRFSKCLIIFLVYNIMTIFTVSCDGSDTVETEKKIVPDFDLITTSEQREYAKYYFRGTRFMDQLKVRPRTFFKSVYNCDYLILPELNEDIDYDAYKNKIKTESKKIFESVVKKYNEYYENVKKEEDHYVQQFEKSYTVTKKAYEEVIMYESQTSNHDQYLKKEDAIIDYLHNQMPEVSEETFPNAYWGNLRYMYKNYEVYADPTDEVYYRSNILQAEYDAVMDGNKIKTCDVILTKEEYDEVQFLYSFLSISNGYQSGFIEAKIEVFLHLQNTLPNLSKIYTRTELLEFEKLHPECDGIENADVEYTNTTTKLTNEFVVNDENYMSYLVRMKMRGKIGFHLDYHKHMYKTRKNYGPLLDATDIYIDNSNRGRYTIDMNIHLTTEQQNYAELTPFNPEDI